MLTLLNFWKMCFLEPKFFMKTIVISNADDELTMLYRMKKVRTNPQRFESMKQLFINEYGTVPMSAYGPLRVINRMGDIIAKGKQTLKVISVLIMDHHLQEHETMTAIERLGVENVFVGTKLMVDSIVGVSHSGTTISCICAFPVRENVLDLEPPFLIVDGVNTSENIGAMMRTAAAMGVTSILCSEESLKCVNSRCARASMGCCFYHRLATPEPGESLAQAIHRLRVGLGITIYAAETEEAGGTEIISPHHDKRWGLVVGNERDGIASQIMEEADKKVFIPQAIDSIDSLNVAHAAAICMFELTKLSN